MKRYSLLICTLAALLCVAAIPWRKAPFSVQVGPRAFYVSTTDGNDTRTTTQAMSPATPWKTLANLNTLMGNNTLSNGDTIYFKSGDLFYGSLTLTKGLRLSSYGSGVLPALTGFYTVTTWTSLGGGIYESEALPYTSTWNFMDMVTINGRQYAMGRTPNANASNGGYLTYESHGTNTITDNTNPFTSSYNGATVVVRTSHFTLERSPVSGISGTTITYAQALLTTPTNSFGYFIENSALTLDQYGEWYYNQSTKKIRVYFGSGGSAGQTVQVATQDIIIEPRASDITISNLAITGTNRYGIWSNLSGVSGLTITNCTIAYHGISSVAMQGRSSFVLQNSRITNANCVGVCMSYHDNRPVIRNNLVRDIGLFPGHYSTDDSSANRYADGIFNDAQPDVIPAYHGMDVYGNTVKNIGYMGIIFVGGADSTFIYNNYVDTFCLNLDDGGGIYTGNGANRTGLRKVRIHDNIVLHGIGAPQGTTSSVMDANAYYLDDNSDSINLYNNVGAYCGHFGVFLHNADSSLVRNNIFFGNGVQIGFQFDHFGVRRAVRANRLVSNQCYARSGQSVMYMAKDADVTNAYNTFADWDSNYYCRPSDETNIITTNWFGHSQVNNYALNGTGQWKATFSEDTHSNITPVATTDNLVLFKYSTGQATTFLFKCSFYLGMDNTLRANKVDIPAYTAIILFPPGTLP